MKQLYRCDYCDFIGSSEEVGNHEINCSYNPKQKTCFSCKYMEQRGGNFSCFKDDPEHKTYGKSLSWDVIKPHKCHCYGKPRIYNNGRL